MTDKRFVVLVLGPIVIASICFTAAASLAKPDAFALRFGGHSGDHPGVFTRWRNRRLPNDYRPLHLAYS
jgi:hypothetical protein